ncbi:two-component sensor histidine kinase [Clostridia bacterium]|nr:two-component sensor histidine kinase [Clostridia bacterium]
MRNWGIFGRRKRINELINQIDRILHGDNSVDISVYKEGQFYILQNEINKMTLRIREQNDALKKDKQYLADSLADIAHQLRTPLTSANLILSMLAKKPSEEERAAFVQELTGLLIRMDWLITALLKLSRLDAGVVEFQNVPVSVKRLIDSALRPLAIGMELRGINLQINAPESIVIQGDFGWLTEAIQNILKNCMENTLENGGIEIDCIDNNLYTEITIHDSGAGFDSDDLPRLFDRFYRGKNANAAGYGIGLALCKMIISRQGGVITAKNHPQGGAVFKLKFGKQNSEFGIMEDGYAR